MDRRLILDLIDLGRPGLEIGALDKPTVTRAHGPVAYVDRADRAALAAWYADPGHGIDPADLVDVDHVWGEETLLQAVGGQRAFAYVIASHVIEHVPDVFGWLGEIAAVLEDGGRAVFAVPDKRFSFDYPRPPSTSGEFVEAWLEGRRRPNTRQIFNHFHDTRPEGAPDRDEAALTEWAQGCVALCRRAVSLDEYIDAHGWVFTPVSMAQALDLASRLELLPFRIADFQPTPPGDAEFMVTLERLPDSWDFAARRAAFLESLQALELPPETQTTGAAPDLLARAEAAIAHAQAIEASTFWRMTAPLRRLVDAARRLSSGSRR
ncbi:methyltransferase domain-containing protein [Phenylobacterium sp.]|jgi:SAM-dependent methyltransferase|uniref:methyltransferase domain-containing protein n=1 Tax=Phenylobacterium sp. TaxID=1871053 RepID=UPI0037C54864